MKEANMSKFALTSAVTGRGRETPLLNKARDQGQGSPISVFKASLIYLGQLQERVLRNSTAFKNMTKKLTITKKL